MLFIETNVMLPGCLKYYTMKISSGLENLFHQNFSFYSKN